MTLRILEAGLYTLVVDFGRPRSRSLGVPVGGAADRFSLALGNALVGNGPDAPALEINGAGPTLQADCELGCVVLGAPFTLVSDRQSLTLGRTFTLEPGETVRIAGASAGMRAYFCCHGGFRTPVILGSRSALQPLRAGALLSCQPSQVASRFLELAWKRDDLPRTLHVVDGLQADWFSEQDFFAREFTVTPASNRMGLRLRSDPLVFPNREMVSEPVCPGTVQVTRDGQCIILGVDGQTIGGYPKIAHVIQADLDRLGQLRPGAPVRFIPVPHDEARRLFLQREDALQAWWRRLTISLE